MNLPKRKPTRLKGYDYGAPGAYFVTICTNGRECILGNIVGQGLLLPKLIYLNTERFQTSFHDHIIRGEKDYQKI